MRHDAFVSYSHTETDLARAIERGLERLAKPMLQLRALNVFRDETSLAANPALWASIVKHLEASEWFVLLASPQSAASPWCTKEIAWWLENKTIERLLLVVTSGELVWKANGHDFDFERTTAISPALRGRFSDEPLYADLRWAAGAGALELGNPRFRDSILNLAAPMRGVAKDELDGEDVRQLRRNRLFVRTLFAAIGVAALLAMWQWRVATMERDAARMQTRVAMSRKLVADSRLPENPLDWSLLLAAEAYQVAPTRDAHEALIRLAHENDRFEQYLRADSSNLTALAVDESGQRLLAGDRQGRMLLWELGWQGARRVFQRTAFATGNGGGATVALRIQAKGDRVVAAGGDGRVTALRVGKGRLVREHLTTCAEWRGAQTLLNADGSRAAVLAHDGSLALWEVRPDGCVNKQPLSPAVDRLFALNASGDHIAARLPTGDVAWWWAASDQPAVLLLREAAPLYTTMLTLSDDGSRLAIAGHNRVELWSRDASVAKRLLRLDLMSHSTSAAFSRAGDAFALGLADGTIELWRFGADAPARHTLRGHRHGFHVTALAFSARGDLIASGAEDGNVMLWYLGASDRDAPISRELRGHARPIEALALGGRGTLVSVSGAEAIVWNAVVSGGMPLLSHLGRNEGVSSSYFDPATGLTLSLPGILLRDEDKDGCSLVRWARAAADRALTPKERSGLVGELEYAGTCSVAKP